MYEAQIMWIRSRPSIDIKALAICHGRMGKMFLKLDKFNRAIVEFDRQLSLGNEIDDKPGEFDDCDDDDDDCDDDCDEDSDV